MAEVMLKQYQTGPNGSRLFVASVNKGQTVLTIQFTSAPSSDPLQSVDPQNDADELLPEARRVLNKLLEEHGRPT